MLSPAAWRAIADPEQRLARALDELYAFYEDTAAMWANVFRDEPLVPAIGPNLARFRGYLDDAAGTLAAGWPATGGVPASSSPRRATPSTSTPGARSPRRRPLPSGLPQPS